MIKNTFFSILFVSFLIFLQGCEVVGGIFKAGMGVGIFLVIAIVALVIFLLSKLGKNK